MNCKFVTAKGYCRLNNINCIGSQCKDLSYIDDIKPQVRPQNQKRVLPCGYDALVGEIIKKAVDDYRKYSKRLLKPKLTKARRKQAEVITADLEKFFNSEWCEDLLIFINIKMTGQAILKKLKEEIWNGC